MPDEFTPFHRGGDGPPLVLLHGFLDTWRTWELVIPSLEADFTVFAPTLPGHAGGPALPEPVSPVTLLDVAETMLDAAGIAQADIVGNSLGGFAALALAARGRARSVVALAPAGGWGAGDDGLDTAIQTLLGVHEQAKLVAEYADQIAKTEHGRAMATSQIVVHWQHIPADLIAHQLRGVASASGARALAGSVLSGGWPPLDPSAITCPVRFVWGTRDLVLPWPTAAERYRDGVFPAAEWTILDDVGHCPQLDVPDVTAGLVRDV